LFVICVNKSIYIRVNRKKSNQVILLKGVSAEFYLLCFLLFNLSTNFNLIFLKEKTI
jgi:hypothetical protein